jgi:hypothetical protein
LWQNGLGAVLPDSELAGLDAAQATLDLIAGLEVDWVIPGHGAPFGEVQQALQTAGRRLQQWRADPQRWADSLLKSLLLFNLLALGRMPVMDLPDYLQSLPLLRDASQRLLASSPQQLAENLLQQLQAAGLLRVQHGMLLPLLPA